MNRKREVNPRFVTHPGRVHAGGGTLIDQIFRIIQGRIQDGTLPARSRLPSVRQLAVEHHVSHETAYRAYDKLVAHGYAEPRRGSGFYVTAVGSVPDSSPATRWVQQSGEQHDWRTLLNCELPYERRPGCGALPDIWMDRAAISNALRGLARMPSRSISDYETVRGYLPLRQQLQIKLGELGIHARTDQIVTTTGAMEALHFVLWSQVSVPRTYVLMEDPGPFMHVQRSLAAGLEIVRVPRETDGPNIEVMREICSRHKPRAFLCSSILHNPTCSNISPHKAFQILKLADEFDFIIIDDDTYGDLLPPMDAKPVARLATLDQLRRVFHIGSFSKTLGAGLRVGFVAGSSEHIEKIALFKTAGVICGSTLGERVVHQILSQGKYRHHCESLRSRLLEIREQTVLQLAGMGCAFPTSIFAGMYLWGSLGDKIDAATVSRAMADRDYLMAPAPFFTHSESSRSYMRFNIAATFRSSCVAALRTVLRDFAKAT